jgi:hypothetical protein
LEEKDIIQIMIGFKEFCNLPTVHGTIDVTHIHIFKLKGRCVIEYFSYKYKAYNMKFQVVVNHKKKFKNAFVGMMGLINDAHVLHISSLH